MVAQTQPAYEGLNRDGLRRTMRGELLYRVLDEQIPHTATPTSILDVGCGTGQLANFLAMSWGRRVVGIDVSATALRVAQEFRDRFSINNAEFLRMDLFQPTLPDNSFDFVIANRVLHHTPDAAAGFHEITRLVKPGGAIVVSLYNRLGRLPALLWHALRRTPQAPASRHSYDEVLGWFADNGVQFTSALPTIGDTEFDPRVPLFEPQPAGRYLDRLSTEIEQMMTAAGQGLFVMIGRRA